MEHALLALPDEFGDAVGFDVALGVEAQLPLHGYLDPEPLTVEAVLIALPLSLHGVVTLPEVLVGSTPGVMDAHRAVGRDWSVQEPEQLVRITIALQIQPLDLVLLPEANDAALQLGHVELLGHRLKHVLTP